MSNKSTLILMGLLFGGALANESDVLTNGINESLRLGGGIYLAESMEIVGSVPSPQAKYWSGYAKLRVLETVMGQQRETLAIPYHYPVVPTDAKVTGFGEELYGFENVPLEQQAHKVLILACSGPMRFGSNPDSGKKLGFSLLTNFTGESDPAYSLAKRIARLYAGEIPSETIEDELVRLAENANHDVLHFLDDPSTGTGQFTRFTVEFAYLNLPPEGFERLVNILRAQLSEPQLQKLLGCAKLNAASVLNVSREYRGPFEIGSKSTLEMRIKWMKFAMADWKAGIGTNGVAASNAEPQTMEKGQVLRTEGGSGSHNIGAFKLLASILSAFSVVFIALRTFSKKK